MLPDRHIRFSRGRSGVMVFPSLSEFSKYVLVKTCIYFFNFYSLVYYFKQFQSYIKIASIAQVNCFLFINWKSVFTWGPIAHPSNTLVCSLFFFLNCFFSTEYDTIIETDKLTLTYYYHLLNKVKFKLPSEYYQLFQKCS